MADHPSPGSEFEEAVHRRVEQHLCQIPLLEEAISQGDSATDEELVAKRKKRALISGRDRISTSVKKRITWPDKVIYGVDGQPATYKDLTVSSFIMGYLIV